MNFNDSITGRDSYIVAQALYVAAKALRSQKHPEESNAEDMEAIAEAWFPGSFEQRRIHERFQEGLRMGLKLPMGGMTITSEAVEAWIAEGDTGRYSEWSAPAGTHLMIALPETMAFGIIGEWTEPDRAVVKVFRPDQPDGEDLYIGAERMLRKVGPEWFEIYREDGWKKCLEGEAFAMFLANSYPEAMKRIEEVEAYHASVAERYRQSAA